jgi:23S rRNA (pseudouridine1915-N3)-methyltransferase
MKLHIVTIGKPKLTYAREGWAEYCQRLSHYHQVRTTHIADKNNDTNSILNTVAGSYTVALVKEGNQFTSMELASYLEKRALESREVSFIIGGPEGLPSEVIEKADLKWSLSELTFPHDLAMVILLETLYRSSTINAGTPYHK